MQTCIHFLAPPGIEPEPGTFRSQVGHSITAPPPPPNSMQLSPNYFGLLFFRLPLCSDCAPEEREENKQQDEYVKAGFMPTPIRQSILNVTIPESRSRTVV